MVSWLAATFAINNGGSLPSFWIGGASGLPPVSAMAGVRLSVF
jgi:hypothetical protein